MDDLNLNHLRYFWAVARAGSIAGAARRLGVGRPAVSAQLSALEGQLGVELFKRGPRSVSLTDVGRELVSHADNVVSAAGDLVDAAESRRGVAQPRMRVGLSPTLATSLLARLLGPHPVLAERRLECRTAQPEALLGELALRRLEVAVLDTLPVLDRDAQLESHELGRHGLTLLGPAPLASRVRDGGPEEIAAVPLVLPARGSRVRDDIEDWFALRNLVPHVAVECDDSALAKRLGASGHGLFAVPTPLAASMELELRVEQAKRLDGIEIPVHLVCYLGGLKQPEIAHLADVGRSWLDGTH
jgi:LysR family transcriptional activator of nhaA